MIRQQKPARRGQMILYVALLAIVVVVDYFMALSSV